MEKYLGTGFNQKVFFFQPGIFIFKRTEGWKNGKLMLIKISHFLSFLYQNVTHLMLLTVCRSKRSRAFVTPNSAVCKRAWWFWLSFLSAVLLGQWWYVPKEKIGLLSACVTPGATNCSVIILNNDRPFATKMTLCNWFNIYNFESIFVFTFEKMCIALSSRLIYENVNWMRRNKVIIK